MQIGRGGITLLSQLGIDTGLDLSGGDYDIAMKTGRTVDGEDINVDLMTKALHLLVVAEASDNLRESSDAEEDSLNFDTNPAYHEIKSIPIPSGYKSGTFRIKFSLRNTAAADAYGKIYKNGVAHGTERIRNGTTTEEFSEDLVFTGNDTIEIWGHGSVGVDKARISNFRIYAADKMVFTWT